jgi:hypothetical protein
VACGALKQQRHPKIHPTAIAANELANAMKMILRLLSRGPLFEEDTIGCNGAATGAGCSAGLGAVLFKIGHALSPK